MFFTISAKKLKAAVKSVSPVLAMSLDAKSLYKNHACFLADSSGLKLIATNGVTTYQYDMTEGSSVTEPGKVAIIFDKLVTSLEGIKPEAELTVELNEKTLYFKTGKKEIQIQSLKADDFDTIENFTGAEIKFAFDSTVVIEKVSQTMCRDQTKKRMNGVFCEFVEIDGKKVVHLKTATPKSVSKISEAFECSENVKTSFIMPEFLVDEASTRPLHSIGLTAMSVIAKFPDLIIETPLPDNKFMDVEIAFTNLSGRDLSFDRAELQEALRFVKSTSDKEDRTVKFMIANGNAGVSSWAKTARAKDSLSCVMEGDANFTVNSDIVSNFLNSISEPEVKFVVSDQKLSYSNNGHQFVTASLNVG